MGCPSSVNLGDTLTFSCTLHDPDTGVATDGDAVPTYRIYEDGTETAISNGNVDDGTGTTDEFDDANTTGFYAKTVTCSAANGYEAGKTYTIYLQATVDSDTGATCYGFKVANSPTYAGDYAVVLTIRTTGGTALSGVTVWLNTANTRSGAVAGPLYTNDSGQVTFYLNYTTYYVFCHLANYTFNAASFTSAAGSVAFTKNIATAISTGSTSNYDNSFLTRAIATVREMVDEPAVNAKYTSDRIITQLEKSYTHILGEVNRNTRTPAVGVYSIDVTPSSTEVQSFALPHNCGSIMAVYFEGDYGERFPANSRGRLNMLGRGVWIDGDTIKVQPMGGIYASSGSSTATMKVEHVPVGVAKLHNGVLTLDADGDAATFGGSPNVGALDTHPQAYLGCTLRILEVDGTTVTGNIMQERTISSYNPVTRVADLDVALSPIPTSDDGNIYYEIAPTIHKGMDEIVATYTAYAIALTEGNHKRAAGILKRYQTEIRTVRLTSYYSRMDEATKQRADSHDVRRYPASIRRL